MPTRGMSTSPDNIFEWQCPYCEETRQKLSDLRDHITESTSAEHAGVDGLKPTRNLIAYGTDGKGVDQIEGVSTGPADPLEEYDKRELIINAWVADRNVDRKAIENISGASQQYVSRLLNELESGEIRRETWIEALDYGLRDELAVYLENYKEEAETAEETTMSAQEPTAEDILEESSKKDRILAASQVSPSAKKKAVADALGVSYEYVRQIHKDLDDRDQEDWEKLQPGEHKKEYSPELLDAVETRLRQTGVGTPQKEDSDESEPEREYDERWEQQGVTASVSGAVSAEEVQAVRERMELLREQAEYTESPEAEFVSKKAIEWLDELLDSAE